MAASLRTVPVQTVRLQPVISIDSTLNYRVGSTSQRVHRLGELDPPVLPILTCEYAIIFGV